MSTSMAHRTRNRMIDFTLRLPAEQIEFIERFQQDNEFEKRSQAVRKLFKIAQQTVEA